jgi:hypothetical protein
MALMRNRYKFLFGKPEETKPLGRPKRRWKDTIKMDLKTIGWEGADWIYVALGKDRWRVLQRRILVQSSDRKCNIIRSPQQSHHKAKK